MNIYLIVSTNWKMKGVQADTIEFYAFFVFKKRTATFSFVRVFLYLAELQQLDKHDTF